MMLLPPFEGSLQKIAHANRHIARLSDVLADFAAKAVLSFDRQDQGPNYLWTPKFSLPPPTEVPLIMGDAIHNLRTALDLMICDLARMRGASIRTRLDYPFEENEAKLNEKLTKPNYKRLGPDIHAAVKATKPYKENGSTGLRGLHELDIWDKHEIIIPTYLAAHAQMRLETGSFFIQFGGYTEVHEGVQLSMRKDFRPPMETIRVTKPTPLLPANMPFAGEPVLNVLNGLSKMTAEIVSRFEGQFRHGYAVPHMLPSGDNGAVGGR